MRSVLIVDDEINICSLIRHEIEWEALRLTLCGGCSDSRQALEMIRRQRPDIVITDIQMPVLDGLELIRQAQLEELPAKFIIISGYSYFEYARQAVRYGVDSFLLKPIDHDELNDALRKALKKLGAEDEQKRGLLQAGRDALSLRRLLLYQPDILGQRGLSLPQVNAEFHYQFVPGFFLAGVLRLDQEDGLPPDPLALEQIARRFCRAAAPLCAELELAELCEHTLLLLMNGAEPDCPALLGKLECFLLDNCQDFFLGERRHITLALAAPVRQPGQLGAAFSQAHSLLAQRSVRGVDRMILPQDKEPLPIKEGASLECFPFQSFWEQIEHLLSLMKTVEAGGAIRRFLEQSHPVLERHPASLGPFCTELLGGLAARLCKEPPALSLVELFSFERLSIKITELCSQLLAAYEAEHANTERKAVQVVKEYIRVHYAEHLGLEILAQQVFLAPLYLGQLFKRETGVNLSDYLLQVRLEKAKELLGDLHYNVSQVAALVGYRDDKYFSRLFRRHIGVSPMEYRKIHRIV